MTRALKHINKLVGSADPNNYDSVSYNKYFKDMSEISNILLEEQEFSVGKEKKILAEIHKLPESEEKTNILKFLQ